MSCNWAPSHNVYFLLVHYINVKTLNKPDKKNFNKVKILVMAQLRFSFSEQDVHEHNEALLLSIVEPSPLF